MAVENIVEELNKLSVLELVELKKTLEEQLGRDRRGGRSGDGCRRGRRRR